MCNTCFNRFSRSKNSFFDTFELKMMAIYIQINIDRWCYMMISKVNFNFLYIPATTRSFLP